MREPRLDGYCVNKRIIDCDFTMNIIKFLSLIEYTGTCNISPKHGTNNKEPFYCRVAQSVLQREGITP